MVGKAKYIKALAVKAGLNIFVPTPPNISFPIIIPKLVPIKTCHKGTSGGIVRGISAQLTKNPSLTSCFLIIAKVSSQIAPATKVAIKIGKTYPKPKIVFASNPRSISMANAFRYPILYAPNK